jgi:hypothetical protein
MTELVIDKRKYVLLLQKEYDSLRTKAALNVKPHKLLTVDEARQYSKQLINKWSKGR